ncbi:UDP-glucose 4-epimerase GalE [Arenibaculum pallidiluteum]|uniref:UDP-glucose 4-epimerase GalE n=1 Tax=Arenibaculum pallidiluteum TaxID=2812559 RepID=UPI001A97B900|nr:UDP-glucose 4-epimerase GalE [Arenibaculum pallidiluteum]
MAGVLVTGGAGFVGSHVAKALAARGHRPVVLDDLSQGHRDAVRWGPLEVASLHDTGALEEILARHGIECVIHCAASISVGESVSDPGRYYHNNVRGTLSLLEAMRTAGVGALVFSSTAAVYGTPQAVPLTEDHPIAPINPYGAGKVMAETMMRDFGSAHGLRTVVLRYFNASGADPDGELGERHDPETHAIPLLLFAAMGHRPAFRVFGTDYATPDGTAVRDYVHVSDLAQAHCAAVDRLLSGGSGLTLNLGSGAGTSVATLIEAVRRVTGSAVPVEMAPKRAGDPPVLVADSTRARELLEWRPRFEDVETIVGTAWRWYLRNPPRPA